MLEWSVKGVVKEFVKFKLWEKGLFIPPIPLPLRR
jgi:hypothetical protein